jgi:hypothetical protein
LRGVRVRIARQVHGSLVTDHAGALAVMFFGENATGVSPTGFDARAGVESFNRITNADVMALLATLRVRGAPAPWDALTAREYIAERAANEASQGSAAPRR